ncbi:MAG: TetR family transcriptional regulator [Nocardia sp.]|nr:TetR family transcriptional regulator [Nocardia sp.]
MAYDGDDTRRRIFVAASAEFAEHGLAGARVDRIATAAQANKQAIYLYYGNKEKLFAIVLQAKLEEICNCVSIELDAVAESVGQLFDLYQQHPQMLRLLLWEALEGGDELDESEPDRRADMRTKIRHLVDDSSANRHSTGTRLRATQDLMFTIMALVSWNFAVPRMCRIVLDEETDQAALTRRRETVIETARALAAAHNAATTAPSVR